MHRCIVEKAFFFVIEKSEGARMHGESRALVGGWRFDAVRDRNPHGDGRPLRQQEPGQCADHFTAKAIARDKSCAHPEGIEIHRRFRLGACPYRKLYPTGAKPRITRCLRSWETFSN